MKYHIDIDGTICITDSSCEDTLKKYASVEPIPQRIAEVNKLYDAGHTVTYWTARGGNSGLDLRDLTLKQLSEWGCKYHFLEMGKPSYDIYIDDKSFNVDSFWPIKVEE